MLRIIDKTGEELADISREVKLSIFWHDRFYDIIAYFGTGIIVISEPMIFRDTLVRLLTILYE
jgi:hypothetical protein